MARIGSTSEPFGNLQVTNFVNTHFYSESTATEDASMHAQVLSQAQTYFDEHAQWESFLQRTERYNAWYKHNELVIVDTKTTAATTTTKLDDAISLLEYQIQSASVESDKAMDLPMQQANTTTTDMQTALQDAKSQFAQQLHYLYEQLVATTMASKQQPKNIAQTCTSAAFTRLYMQHVDTFYAMFCIVCNKLHQQRRAAHDAFVQWNRQALLQLKQQAIMETRLRDLLCILYEHVPLQAFVHMALLLWQQDVNEHALWQTWKRVSHDASATMQSVLQHQLQQEYKHMLHAQISASLVQQLQQEQHATIPPPPPFVCTYAQVYQHVCHHYESFVQAQREQHFEKQLMHQIDE